MSKIKNGALDQYGAEPFEQQQFGTAGGEGVNLLWKSGGYRAFGFRKLRLSDTVTVDPVRRPAWGTNSQTSVIGSRFAYVLPGLNFWICHCKL